MIENLCLRIVDDLLVDEAYPPCCDKFWKYLELFDKFEEAFHGLVLYALLLDVPVDLVVEVSLVDLQELRCQFQDVSHSLLLEGQVQVDEFAVELDLNLSSV